MDYSNYFILHHQHIIRTHVGTSNPGDWQHVFPIIMFIFMSSWGNNRLWALLVITVGCKSISVMNIDRQVEKGQKRDILYSNILGFLLWDLESAWRGLITCSSNGLCPLVQFAPINSFITNHTNRQTHLSSVKPLLCAT